MSSEEDVIKRTEVNEGDLPTPEVVEGVGGLATTGAADGDEALVASNKLFESRVGRAEYPGHNPAADLVTPEQAEHFDRTRAAYQNEWEQTAQVINDSRPRHGLLRKKTDPEHTWQDVMREEADDADQRVNIQMRVQPGYSDTRQEAVEELESRRNERGAFHNPLESDDYFEHSATRDSKQKAREAAENYWKTGEKIQLATGEVGQEIRQALLDGNIAEAGTNYSKAVFDKRGYFDPRYKAELDKQLKDSVAGSLDEAFTQGDADLLADIIGTDLADIVTAHDLKSTQEQRQTEEMRKAAVGKVIELMKYVTETDSDEIGYGWSKPLWLAKRLDRLSKLGITANYEETVSLPEIREAAMDLVLGEAAGQNKDTIYRTRFNWPYDLGPLRQLGLVDTEEFKRNPQVQEICRDITLKDIASTEIDWRFTDQSRDAQRVDLPLAETFNGQMNALQRDGIVDPHEILRSAEGRKAAESFVEDVLTIIEKSLENRQGINQILGTWENYLSKIKILFDPANLGNAGAEQQASVSPELTSRIETVLTRMKDEAEIYRQRQTEAAGAPLEELVNSEQSIRELGLAS